MSCQDVEIALGEYVDGTLGEPARTAFEAHLAGCERCRALVSDLRAIRQITLALEPALPAPHVWTRISAALEAERGGGGGLRGWGTTWRMVAASAVTVVLVSSLWWVGTHLVPANDQRGRLASAAAAAPIETTSVKAEFEFAEAQYTSAIAGLESITHTERAALDMETADVLQANLTVIDGAISESRAALQTEPDSPAAQESLFEALRSKVELLQEIVSLINEMRKGNQEGVARIVSGLNQ